MSKLFYDHLIILEDITVVLEKHDVPHEERKALLAHIDETLHGYILDTVLTHLPNEHHEHFLGRLAREPYHHSLLDFLKEKTKVDIEHEIHKTIEDIKAKIKKDIEDALEEQ